MGKISLVCNLEGDVLDVTVGESFAKVCKETVGANNGEFLVELNDDALTKYLEFAEKLQRKEKGGEA